MNEDHRPDPPPETSEAPVCENSSRPRSRVKRTIRKFAKGVTKKLFKFFKIFRNRIPANQNVDLPDASTTVVQTVEIEGASSSQKNEHLATSQIPSDCVNQGPRGEPDSQVQAAPSGEEEVPDTHLADAELQGALDRAHSMGLLGKHATSVASAADNAPAGLDAADNFETKYLQPLKIIDGVLDKIADVHPYAKMALGVLSAASKIIIDQAERDQSIYSLLQKLAEVYRFMTRDDNLGKIESMRGIVRKIVQQTQECARFIRDYSETKNFWKRIGKNVLSETDDTIKQYSDILDDLMQQFRDEVDRDVAIFVQRAGETLDLSGMVYAGGAGVVTTKQCLSGTRTDILSQITKWINNNNDSVPRVMWLSGPAGKGKSAIAHTIANWFKETGGLGSCFCFDRHREGDRLHEKIFSTIALDLADRDPGMKRALAAAVGNDTSLKNTRDIIQQWRELLMEPLKKFPASSVGPVLIVIDALDESGGIKTRQDLIRILAGKLQNKKVPQITELPSNFRILVTSRPLPDIEEGFEGAGHILRLSMDSIPPEVAKSDIQAFVSEELKERSGFQDTEFADLAAKADGLFEWARLACEYIKNPPPGVRRMDRFDALMKRSAGKQKNLLYNMYLVILKEIMNRDRYDDDEQYEKALGGFRSVMGQILGTAEPLPFNSLHIMRKYFPDRSKHDNMDIIKHMGSLLSGTTNLCTPIRPLHASFHDFLTDKSSSGAFFVDVSKVQRDLAFASLRVMEHGLGFNICGLKSSYLPNSQDMELPERIKTSISPHLSYSCRYWATHVQTMDFDDELAKEIRSLFGDERMMFWIEALGLLDAISGAIVVLPLVAKWLKHRSGYEDLRSATMDIQRFMQVFGGVILHSTPHLYLSALPFSPVNSTMATKFTAKFQNTLRLASGRDLNWTVIQAIIRGHTGYVWSVSFSPDGTRIASGSEDKTVRLWNAATGQPLGEPLKGHTGAVRSVSFSPDGTRIASGSEDNTVRLWNAATGQLVGEPLEGHTGVLRSVSFSPDGTRLASGSYDNTVRLWNAATGQPLGEPLKGHTGVVRSVSFSPNGTHVASGSDDNTVRLWNAATGQPLGGPWKGHTDSVFSVSFSPDGTRIASGSMDNTVRLWNAATGQPLGEPLEGHTDTVLSVSFSPDGTRIMSGSQDYTMRLWNAATGQPLGEPLKGHTGPVYSISFSPDGTGIASGSYDNTVRLWNAATGQPLGEPLKGHTGAVRSVSFSPDGTHIVSGSMDNTVRLWNAAMGQPLGEPLKGHTGMVWSVSFSPDGTRIASGSEDKTVRLWNAATGQPLGEPLKGHTAWVFSVSFSPDGTRIASGSMDNTVRLWNAATGQPLGEPLEGHAGWVYSVSFSPDGTRIASGSQDKTVRLWNAATGQPLGEPLKGHTDIIFSVLFSPDGTRIASGSHDKTVRLWNAAMGQPLGESLKGHTGYVLSVSFSPDGTSIASGSEDKTMRLMKVLPFPESTETNPSASLLHRSTASPTQASPITPSNTCNHSPISFSPCLTHALPNPADLLEPPSDHHSNSTPFFLQPDGWIMGPNHELLFWVPPASRHAFYTPWTSLVIPRGGVELDLSCMAHGTRWSSCRNAST